MKSKLWVFRDINLSQRALLVQGLSISPATASLFLARGVTTPDEATSWMSLQSPHDPFLIPDMEQAIERLHRAVTTQEPICFYGDYDVDGITATSVYLSFFGGLGAKVRAYVPHRLREGYGLNLSAVQRLHDEGISLLVTSDCGTTSHKEIALAAKLGMDVVVTDHHQSDEEMPPAVAVLNPPRAGALYPFRGLCSVADVVPLHDENRNFVREGLVQLSRGARCGVRALKQVAGVTKDCTAETIAFKLAPRINAAGRLDDAMLGVRLLTTDNPLEAQQLADRLEQLNRERQRIEVDIMEETLASLKDKELPPAVVVASRNWHLGVVGIVAARLVDRFQRPAIVLAINEQGIAKGSARTTGGFDLYQGLASCREMLEAFGGHPSAAGVTIRESRIDEFRAKFSDAVAGWTHEGAKVPTLNVDAEVRLDEVNLKLIQEICSLHPFGAGNPEPTFAVTRLEVLEARTVGEKHLKMTVRQGTSLPFDSIAFGMKSLLERGIPSRTPVDLAFTPELNHWNGRDRIQLRIRDVRPSVME
ncbi:MAG: DHHA1 domain-containing protein [Nitrospirae bacterium]|nr:DHHA1 domain-containing protein [Nitrospirota bacterium]